MQQQQENPKTMAASAVDPVTRLEIQSYLDEIEKWRTETIKTISNCPNTFCSECELEKGQCKEVASIVNILNTVSLLALEAAVVSNHALKILSNNVLSNEQQVEQARELLRFLSPSAGNHTTIIQGLYAAAIPPAIAELLNTHCQSKTE